MNSDNFSVQKINVIPATFQKGRDNNIPGYLVTDVGKIFFTLPETTISMRSLNSDGRIIDNLVEKNGFIHIWPIDKSIFISFRPKIVNFMSMTSAFYLIACFRPERVFLSTDAENAEWEVFDSGQRAMIRIERLVTASAEASQPNLPGIE